MSIQSISCPGGSASQTGTAVKERYPNANILNCGGITDVHKLLQGNTGLYVVPIWNSHEGEVKAADFFWDLIEQEKIKVFDLWAKQIEFWFVTREPPISSTGKIGSVVVARTQCSRFIRNYEFVPYALTVDALDAYREGAPLDGVLVAPGQGEDEPGYKVTNKETANPNNFTTFVRVVPSNVQLEAKDDDTDNNWITAVVMRSLETSLGETEQSFFDQMLNSVKDLNEMPKLIFAFKRTSKVGLLFEGPNLYLTDLLDAEEIEKGDILMHEKAGSVSKLYTKELNDLFGKKFQSLRDNDFILHRGVNTCLFACPPLGLYTHGYEIETVEPVVRFYINKIFELIDSGVKCANDQTEFFNRYKADWQASQSQFIKFKEIDPFVC
jgi:prephenate dehydratase